jgi:hypothetical protein
MIQRAYARASVSVLLRVRFFGLGFHIPTVSADQGKPLSQINRALRKSNCTLFAPVLSALGELHPIIGKPQPGFLVELVPGPLGLSQANLSLIEEPVCI